jgi:phospholipid transport system substrate-binding protein
MAEHDAADKPIPASLAACRHHDDAQSRETPGPGPGEARQQAASPYNGFRQQPIHRIPKPMKAFSLTGALVLLLLAARPGLAPQSAVAEAASAPPDAVVARVNETLMGAMQEAEALAFQGRYDRIDPVFREAFHFPFMARVAAGSYWRDLDAGQKNQLADAFARMSVTTYAARFDGYSGQSFEVGETIEQPRGGALVRNHLFKSDGEAVSIDYLLRDFDGRWRIVDVFLDGSISEIATKRSEYTSILDQDGFDGLLARIDAKTAELAKE